MTGLLTQHNEDTGDTDESLFAATGDVRNFDILYGRYRQRIHRYITFKTQNPGVAEELTQEVFFRIHEMRHSFNAERDIFSFWLFRAAKSLAYSCVAQRKPMLYLDKPIANGPGEGMTIELADRRPLIEDHLIESQRTTPTISDKLPAHKAPNSAALGLSLKAEDLLAGRASAKRRSGRCRFQNGWVEESGKRRKRWRLHWYVYIRQPDGKEKRAHRTAAIPVDECTIEQANGILREIIRTECGQD